MKVNPEMGNIVNVITKEKDAQYQKRAEDARAKELIADIVSVENKNASRSRVENVDEAKQILSQVTKEMENVSNSLYSLNFQRVSMVIGS